MNNFIYFIIGGFILLGILGIFALPVDSTIPPTPAFRSFNGTGGNVTATTYSDNLELIEGSNISYLWDYVEKTLTISSTGTSITSIHQIGNVTSTGCAENQILKVNSTGYFICASDNTGAGGESNTASSPSVGYSLVLPKVGVDLPFKGIFCAGDLSCSQNSTDVKISYTATAMGSSALDDLTDVIITSPAALSTLFYDGVNWIDKIFSVNSFDVNCSDTQQINRLQLDNQTGIVTGTCETDETGSGGTPRGGYLVAHWTMSQTKSNIGTSFVDVYSQTNSNGKAIFIDTDTFTTVRLHVQWNKVGAGTQTCQVINGATVLVSTDVVSGSNDSGFDAIPAGLLNAENAFRIQCKSTTSTDDPIFESASIWMK